MGHSLLFVMFLATLLLMCNASRTPSELEARFQRCATRRRLTGKKRYRSLKRDITGKRRYFTPHTSSLKTYITGGGDGDGANRTKRSTPAPLTATKQSTPFCPECQHI